MKLLVFFFSSFSMNLYVFLYGRLQEGCIVDSHGLVS